MADRAFTNAFVDDRDLVLLYRDDAGKMLARRRPAEWSNFFRIADVPAGVMRDLRASRAVVGVSEEGEFVRVRWADHESRARAFGLGHGGPGYFGPEGVDVEHFEADVDPVRRFFAETGAKVARPRRAYLDIETDSRVPPQQARDGKARVLCWALTDDAGWKKRGVLPADSDEAEATLLEGLWESLNPYDQVVAWFGDGFDFPIVRRRANKLGAKTKDFRRWLFCDHMEIFERNNKNSAESGDEKVSMKLEDVAQAKIGEGKEKTPPEVVARFGDKSMGSLTWQLWEAGGEFRELMARYCERDVALLPKIEVKTGYLALHDAVCEVCSCFPDTRSAHPTTFSDGYMLRLGVERGLRFKTRARFEEETAPRKKFAGAWVMEPTRKGIVRDVHVADFSGMYPSIIESFNMSPETKRMVPFSGPLPPGVCRTPSTRQGFALDPPGILTVASKAIGKMRKVWSKKQGELPPGTSEWRYAGQLSMGYKVVRNSLFGIAGSPFSRFGDPAIGEAITQTGVWLIQKTIAEAAGRGIEAIYGDTDALHATNVARERFSEFADWCNRELYPPAIAACGCVENLIEIAYEKEYERIVYVSAKRYIGNWRSYKWTTSCTCTTAKGDPGALDIRTMTCRDCGLAHATLPPPRGDPEIKGLEYKRGDASKMARSLQYEAIEKLMIERCEEPAEFVPIVERARAHILEGNLGIADVQLSQSLSRPLKEYATKTKNDGTQTADLPHVAVGKILKERGEQVGEGTRVFYYVADASRSPMRVAPAVDYAGECDRTYLWSNRTWPATKRVLEAAFPGTDWKAFDAKYPKKDRVREQVDFGLEPGFQPARKVVRKDAPGQGTLFELPSPAASSRA